MNILNVAHGDDAKPNPLKALSACVKGVYILVYTVGISIVLQAQFHKLVVYLFYMWWRDLKNVGKVERRARWTSGQLGNHIYHMHEANNGHPFRSHSRRYFTGLVHVVGLGYSRIPRLIG